MIVDWVENLPKYYAHLPGLEAAMRFIAEHPDWNGERREFDGGYAVCQQGETKPLDEGTFEAHIKYIDVQIIRESAAWYTLWNRVQDLEEAIPYNAEKDCARYGGEGPLLELRPGMFAVFYPEDAHKADRFLKGGIPVPYKKHLIKLLADRSADA